MKRNYLISLLVLLFIAGCGEKIPKTALELYNRAEMHRQAKDTEAAIKDLKLLVEHFGDDIMASKSQYVLGDIFMNDLRDFETAITEYRKVISDFSAAPEEPHAHFMIGYIYSNILSQFDKAQEEYHKFLIKFPDHELTPSVKFEMEYMGKDINEIEVLKHIAS